MALIVEDGSNVPNANSFVTREEYIAYAAARGVTIADVDASDVDAIKAMDWMSSRCYRGTPTYDDQELPFPRTLVNPYTQEPYFEVDSIPKAVKKSQLELMMAVHSGIDLMPNVQAGKGTVKRTKVGPMEKEYFDGGRYETLLPTVSAALSWFECGQGAPLIVLKA